MAILILHLCGFEDFVALPLLARVFVIPWLAIDFRLIEIRIEVARVRAITYVYDESIRENRSSTYCGTIHRKPRYDQKQREASNTHFFRLTGAFRAVNENSCVLRHRSG